MDAAAPFLLLLFLLLPLLQALLLLVRPLIHRTAFGDLCVCLFIMYKVGCRLVGRERGGGTVEWSRSWYLAGECVRVSSEEAAAKSSRHPSELRWSPMTDSIQLHAHRAAPWSARTPNACYKLNGAIDSELVVQNRESFAWLLQALCVEAPPHPFLPPKQRPIS
jgi:hypothetical protein